MDLPLPDNALHAKIILVLGTSLSPFRRTSATSLTLPPNSVYVYCIPTPNVYWPLALVVYQGVLAFVGVFFIFKTRNLFDELNESKEIGLMIYNLLFVGVIVIILLYLVNLGPSAFYAIQAVGMLWVAATTIGLLYVPKLYSAVTGKSWNDRSGSLQLGKGGQTKSELSRSKSRKSTPVSTHQTSSEKEGPTESVRSVSTRIEHD